MMKHATALLFFTLIVPSHTKHGKSEDNEKSASILKDALLLASTGTGDRSSRSRSKRHEPSAAAPPTPSLCFPFDLVSHAHVLEHDSFLPDASDGSPSPCHDPAGIALRKHLTRLASPSQCEASQQLVTDNVGYGFGSVLNSWVKPYMYAVDKGWSFWSPPLGSYADKGGFKGGVKGAGKTGGTGSGGGGGGRCGVDSMACWFRPLSECETAEELVGERKGCREGKNQRNPVSEPRGRPCVQKVIAENRSLNEYSLMHKKTNKEDGLPRSVPEAWRHKGHFWYVSQLLGQLLLHPNRDFDQVLLQAKRDAGWFAVGEGGNAERGVEPTGLRPLLSLHVRRGDSCNPEQEDSKKRRCEDLKAYMTKAVLPMAKKYGIKSIFLATDDEKTVKETKQWPEFNWLVVPGFERGEVKKSKWEANLRSGALDNFGEAQAALVDLLLMSEGDAFVGKFTSNLDRIAYSLLAASKGGLVPYMSLDSKWCNDWGRNAGTSKFGTFFC